MDMELKRCSCYHEEVIHCFDVNKVEPEYKTIGRCLGTKERDTCSCGGYEAKCDFYPEKREAAKNTDGIPLAEFSKILNMDGKELIDHIIDKVAEKRNINATIYLNGSGPVSISIYPYE
jgi:hypothetical protein